jgi:hypothetical protein
MLLFSDGIAEARRASGEPLGYDVLAAVLTRLPAPGQGPGTTEAWLDGVLGEIQRETSPVLEDDWTAVAVECRRGGGA